jgi:hypothetical protein
VYPDALRRVSYFDAETNNRLRFLTNNFGLSALTIAHIFKSRWKVELFYGTSENAVKTQIWVALSVYMLVAIVRKRLGLEASLYQILQILSVTRFEKTPILQALQASYSENGLLDTDNQLILFDLSEHRCTNADEGAAAARTGCLSSKVVRSISTVAPLAVSSWAIRRKPSIAATTSSNRQDLRNAAAKLESYLGALNSESTRKVRNKPQRGPRPM